MNKPVDKYELEVMYKSGDVCFGDDPVQEFAFFITSAATNEHAFDLKGELFRITGVSLTNVPASGESLHTRSLWKSVLTASTMPKTMSGISTVR